MHSSQIINLLWFNIYIFQYIGHTGKFSKDSMLEWVWIECIMNSSTAFRQCSCNIWLNKCKRDLSVANIYFNKNVYPVPPGVSKGIKSDRILQSIWRRRQFKTISRLPTITISTLLTINRSNCFPIVFFTAQQQDLLFYSLIMDQRA